MAYYNVRPSMIATSRYYPLAAGIATAALLGACSSAHGNAQHAASTPSLAAEASPTVNGGPGGSPWPPLNTPPPASASPTSSGAVRCRIPIYFGGEAYFLSVPTGDTTSPRVIGNFVGDLLQTTDTPLLVGTGAAFTFDRAMNRWVPAPWAAVSPDGKSYAYATGGPFSSPHDVHVVDVASAADRVVARNGHYSPLQFDTRTLYLDDASAGAGTPDTGGMLRGSGLYAVDLPSGTIRQLFPSGSARGERWDYVIAGYAYGSDLNPGDPNPSASGEVTDELVRLDLSTGATIHFQYHSGSFANIAGTTPDGRLIVSTDGQGLQILDKAGNTSRIEGAPPDAWVWFSGATQTWLVTHNDFRIFELLPDHTARYVMTMTGPTAGNGWWSWGGSCG